MAWVGTPVKIASFIANLENVQFSTSLGDFQYAIVAKDAPQPTTEDGSVSAVPVNLSQSDGNEYDLWIYETSVSNKYIFQGTVSIAGSFTEIYQAGMQSTATQVEVYVSNLLTTLDLSSLDDVSYLYLSGNGLTAVALDSVISKMYSNAIDSMMTSGVLYYLNNTGTDDISIDSINQAEALKEISGWTVNGSSASSSDIETIYDAQAIILNKSGNFTFIRNIDASVTATWNSGAGLQPIGDETNPFTGTINFNGYGISNLYINRPTESDVGFVGSLSDSGSISNGYVTCNITGNRVVGGICGRSSGNISNCYSGGSIIGVGSAWFGGIVGTNIETGTVDNCYSTVNIDAGTALRVGGICGDNRNDITICHYYGTSLIGGATTVGGIVGYNNTTADTVEYCYTIDTFNVIGTASVQPCTNCNQLSASNFLDSLNFTGFDFSTDWDMGVEYPILRVIPTALYGFVGEDLGTITNSYWDTERSLVDYDPSATPYTSEEMAVKANFSTWDFVDIWFMTLYPILQTFITKGSKDRFGTTRDRFRTKKVDRFRTAFINRFRKNNSRFGD